MQFKFPPLTKIALAFIIINASIWLFFIAASYIAPDTANSAYALLALQPQEVFEGKVHQVFSYMWLHDLNSPFHLILNLFVLYLFAPILENFHTKWKAIGSCLIAGMVGAVFCLLFWKIAQLFTTNNHTIIVGFSAVTSYILALFCLKHRSSTILLFFLLPVKAIHLLYAMLAVDFLIWISLSGSVAFPAHLGGVATALVVYFISQKSLSKKAKSKYHVRML